MTSEREREASRAAVQAVADDLQTWRTAHPQATFTEIEVAVEERLAAVRARLVADVAGGGSEAGSDAERSQRRLCCPHCGQELQRRGQRVRAVTVRGGEAVRLARQYGVCLACGVGLFPPG
jgi:hypothetical protein